MPVSMMPILTPSPRQAMRCPDRRGADPGHAVDVVERMQLDAPHRAHARQHRAGLRTSFSRHVHAKAVGAHALRRERSGGAAASSSIGSVLARADTRAACARCAARHGKAAVAAQGAVELGDSRCVELHEHFYFRRTARALVLADCLPRCPVRRRRSASEGCTSAAAPRHGHRGFECMLIHWNDPRSYWYAPDARVIAGVRCLKESQHPVHRTPHISLHCRRRCL